MNSWPQLPPPVSGVFRKSHMKCTVAAQPQCSPWVLCVFGNISQESVVHYLTTPHRLSKYHTVCRTLLGFATVGWPVVEITSNIFRCWPELNLIMPMLTWNPSKVLIQAPSRVLIRASSRLRLEIDQDTSCTAAKLHSVLISNVSCWRVLSMCHSVPVISCTPRT